MFINEDYVLLVPGTLVHRYSGINGLKYHEDTFRHTPDLYMCYGVEQNYVYI